MTAYYRMVKLLVRSKLLIFLKFVMIRYLILVWYGFLFVISSSFTNKYSVQYIFTLQDSIYSIGNVQETDLDISFYIGAGLDPE